MDELNTVRLTREKHLDHLVRVVPVLVVCYAIQCFFIINLGSSLMATVGLSFVGGILATMIMAFIGYDLKHQVSLEDSGVKVDFFFFSQNISYNDITSVEIRNPGENFSTLVLETIKGKTVFYFIDDAEKIKKIIEDKKNTHFAEAA